MPISKNIKLLALFNFFTDFDLFSPLAIIYYGRIAGSFSAAMTIFSTVMISAAVFEVPTGIVSDRIGRRKTLIAGAVSSLLAGILLASSQNYWMILLSAVVAGLARSFYSGNNDALLYDSLLEAKEQADFGHHLGRVSSYLQVALAISAVLGSVMAQFSFQLVLWFSVLPRLMNVGLSFAFIEPKRSHEKSANVFAHAGEALGYLVKNKKLRLLTIAKIISFSLGEAGFKFRGIFVNSLWPLWAVGFAQVLSNIGSAMGYYFSGKAIKRFSGKNVLITGYIYNRIINLVALLFPTRLSPALMSSSALFYGVNDVASEQLMHQEYTNHQRATMSSLTSLLGSVMYALVAFLLGWWADQVGAAWALITIQSVLFVVPGLYWRVFN